MIKLLKTIFADLVPTPAPTFATSYTIVDNELPFAVKKEERPCFKYLNNN